MKSFNVIPNDIAIYRLNDFFYRLVSFHCISCIEYTWVYIRSPTKRADWLFLRFYRPKRAESCSFRAQCFAMHNNHADDDEQSCSGTQRRRSKLCPCFQPLQDLLQRFIGNQFLEETWKMKKRSNTKNRERTAQVHMLQSRAKYFAGVIVSRLQFSFPWWKEWFHCKNQTSERRTDLLFANIASPNRYNCRSNGWSMILLWEQRWYPVYQ